MFIIAIFSAALHLGWAFLLWDAPQLHTVAISPFYDLIESSRTLAITLVLISLTPIATKLWSRSHWLLFVSLIPQQLTMMMTAIGAVYCVLASHYADGVIRPRAFIAADQWGNIIPTVLHTVYVAHIFIECMSGYVGNTSREGRRP